MICDCVSLISWRKVGKGKLSEHKWARDRNSRQKIDFVECSLFLSLSFFSSFSFLVFFSLVLRVWKCFTLSALNVCLFMRVMCIGKQFMHTISCFPTTRFSYVFDTYMCICTSHGTISQSVRMFLYSCGDSGLRVINIHMAHSYLFNCTFVFAENEDE